MKREEEKPRDLSRSEWKIMRIVWDLKKGMAREVYTVAGELHGWSPATVKTMLKRLVDKGHLETTKVGNGFVYRPTQSAVTILKAAAEHLLSHAIDGTTGPVIEHLVQAGSLSEQELASLQRLIEEKKRALASESSRKRKAEKG